MKLYEEILRLTRLIEASLQQDDMGESLKNMLQQRGELFKQIQENTTKEIAEARDLIKQIMTCETRCVALAHEKQGIIKNSIQLSQKNKRRHTAYSQQMMSAY